MPTQHEINTLIDKLTLDMLDLIQQEVSCMMQMERVSTDGHIMIAKSRYIQGQRAVSVSQLPSEGSEEFKALATVTNINDELSRTKFELKRNAVDKDNGWVDPTRWFGILVPQSLQMARTSFDKAVEYAVECANIKFNLSNSYMNILKLRMMRGQMESSN